MSPLRTAISILPSTKMSVLAAMGRARRSVARRLPSFYSARSLNLNQMNGRKHRRATERRALPIPDSQNAKCLDTPSLTFGLNFPMVNVHQFDCN